MGIRRFPVHHKIANLSFTPRELFGGDGSPKQFVDQPNPVGVQHVTFAIPGHFFDLSGSYSSSLKGLGNVNFTGLIGGFADYWAMPWLRSRVEVLAGFGGATGVMTNLSIDAVIPLSTALTWSGGPRARYVTSGLESPYFSITQEQSIASGLPVYNAGSGWQALGAGTQLKYRFNPTWMTYAFVESPLRHRSSRSPAAARISGHSASASHIPSQ